MFYPLQEGFVGAEVSDDGRWLHLSSGSGSIGNRLWIVDLGRVHRPTSPRSQ